MFFSDIDIITLLILMVPAIINLLAIYHAYNRIFPSSTERILWLVLTVVVPVLGGLAYFIFGRKRGHKELTIEKKNDESN